MRNLSKKANNPDSRVHNNAADWVHLVAFAIPFLSALASTLTLFGLRASLNEIKIRPEYVPFVASIVSAVVGLAMIFILARAFYKKRVQSRVRLAKSVRSQEARLFELAALDFNALVSAHGRR